MGVCDFNDMELDAIGEIMNISLGASATAVSTMLGTKVNITTPVIRVLTSDEFEFKSLEPAVGVEIAYTEGLKGNNIMMFRRNDVRIIVGMLMGGEIPEEEFELNEINLSAICEVMNQMMGSSATALSEFLGNAVNISTPVSFPVESEDSFKKKYFFDDERMVVVRFSLEIEGKLESEFLNIMSSELAKLLLEPFADSLEAEADSQRNAAEEEEREAQQRAAQTQATVPQPQMQEQIPQMQEQIPQMQEQIPQMQTTVPQPQTQGQIPQSQAAIPQPQYIQPAGMAPVYQAAPDPIMLQLLNQMQQSQLQMMEMVNELKSKEKGGRESMVIHPVTTARLEDGASGGMEERANQEMLMKVPLEISVEIGRTKKLVRDILELTQGSLVVLDKMAGEQVDLFVNGQCIAKGDVVVVEDNFGIRITEIITRNLNPEVL
ncbi:flagellar motor switch protein FliN [Hungatella sp.]|uniref:flagellar motor switch protein FliN n=1 Tax=Hungatella sp. TaxID=2613924 RepID=UPI002A8084C6|nr:flagellar motor switch protein FliN [Hungatella sp.]